MTILAAGTFVVATYRKSIPLAIKLAVIVRQKACDDHGVPFTDADVGSVEFDHDPALANRPYDTGAGDFIPPQHDPVHIVARRKAAHLQKTTGRKEGAERTVTTRDSDVGERARARNIRDSERLHHAALAAKVGNHSRAALLRSQVERPSRLSTQKRKLQSRGFSKGKRPMRSRNNLRRTKR